MKRNIGILLLFFVLLSTSGCMRLYETFKPNADGTITLTVKTCIDKSLANENSNKSAIPETLEDGKEYYTESTTSTVPMKEFHKETSKEISISPDIFYYRLNNGSNSFSTANLSDADRSLVEAIQNGIYVKITVQLSDVIVDTNGTLDETGTIVSFDTNNIATNRWYAYTAAGMQQIQKDITAPTITGVQNQAYYKVMPDIRYTDNTAVVKVELNGVPVISNDDSGTKTYDWRGPSNGKSDPKKQGKNVLTAYDANGNSSTVNFYLDKKAPTIQGVKKNKTYQSKAVIYVKDSVKLSKVTINKKKQSLSSNKLVKKGTYKGYYKFTVKKSGSNIIVAYDKAGNKKSVKFKIVK